MATLKAGDRLNVNDELPSDDGRYRLLLSDSGNLALYSGIPSPNNVVWSTATSDLPRVMRPAYAELGADGNFVLFSELGQPIWSTGSGGHPGAQLAVQDDRNLVIYDAAGAPVWASMTNVPARRNRTSSITTRVDQEVGWGKRMQSAVTLYRDGRLVVDSYNKNDNWFSGLRGRTLVVVVDGQGRSIWVSQVFQDPTRCSVPDFSCASYGRVTHVEQFPEPVGRLAAQLDVFVADNAHYVNLRNAIIDALRAAGDIAQVIKDVLDQLQK